MAQERQVFRWINGKDARQYGFDFGLWTRHVVAELVAERFGIKLSLASVGKLLAELGLTPQKPLMRAGIDGHLRASRSSLVLRRWSFKGCP